MKRELIDTTAHLAAVDDSDGAISDLRRRLAPVFDARWAQVLDRLTSP